MPILINISTNECT